mgnify:CR=1 FL=1
MAIIKCADVVEEAGEVIDLTGSAPIEPFTEEDEVSIGKKLLAVESTSFSPASPYVDELPEVRNADILDTLRADAGLYWYLSDDEKMVHPILGYVTVQEFVPYSGPSETITGSIGLTSTNRNVTIIGHSGYFSSKEKWEAIVNGTDESRPSSLIPVGQTFTDHAFQMNTPFSKKELEMFANIANVVSVADVESDYDFYSRAYEEGIASTTVPENALPHLYTEIQRGESEEENTIIRELTTERTQVKEGYFREWMNDTLSNPDKMSEIAEDYENVAILDSVVSEDFIIDSEIQTTSAFEILMAYANRENLFPMNMNIGMDTLDSSNVMLEAEDVGMVDDIVRLLMGEGNVEPVAEFVDEPVIILTEEVLESGYNKVADSMAKLNQNKAVTAAMSDNFVTQVATFIADLINGDYFEDQAMDILNQVSLINSNGGFMPVDMEEITAAIQGLTNLIDSNSLMNNIVQKSEMMNNVAEVNNMATNMATNMVSNVASNMVKKL